jgi:hypothetical protein
MWYELSEKNLLTTNEAHDIPKWGIVNLEQKGGIKQYIRVMGYKTSSSGLHQNFL